MSLILFSTTLTSFNPLQSCWQPRKHHFLASEIFPLSKNTLSIKLLWFLDLFQDFTLESTFSVRFSLVTFIFLAFICLNSAPFLALLFSAVFISIKCSKQCTYYYCLFSSHSHRECKLHKRREFLNVVYNCICSVHKSALHGIPEQ